VVLNIQNQYQKSVETIQYRMLNIQFRFSELN